MNARIQSQLDELKKVIRSGDYQKEALTVQEWGGADVIITKKPDKRVEQWLADQHVVISYQNTIPQKRLVVTDFSRELSWLFYQVRDIFSGRIDFTTKYDFFGTLAQAALDYAKSHEKPGNC